ncbi:unnamed protein product, partial [Brenthis ino]
MTTNSTGAVFFLGSRAHYQVLEQPNNYDAKNGNTSTETIYQNQSVEELWPKEQTNKQKYDANYNLESQWTCTDQNSTVSCDKQSTVKRRVKRRSSEALLCEMKPAVLNHVRSKEEEAKPNRNSLISYLTSLARRKCRLESDRIQYLKHIESVLNNCTYRESCRCLDCQVRKFEFTLFEKKDI